MQILVISLATAAVSTATPDSPVAAAGFPGQFLDALAWLAVIVMLIIGMARLLQSARNKTAGGARAMQIVSSLSLGQKEKLVLLRIDDQLLLLGATAHSISKLHTVEGDALGSNSELQNPLAINPTTGSGT